MKRLAASIALLLSVAAPLEAATLSADGELRYELYGYPDPDRRGDAVENVLEGRLRARGELATSLGYRVDTRVVADDADFTAGVFDPRTRAAGLTASYPLGESVLLRTEVLYYASPDAARDDFFQDVPLSIEYTRGDWRIVMDYLATIALTVPRAP